MTVEIFRAISPFLTLFLIMVMGVIAFFLRWMVNENKNNFTEIKEKIGDLEKDMKAIDQIHRDDQTKLVKSFVDKESFHRAIGSHESVVKNIYDKLNSMSATLNQTIGELKARRPKE